MALTSDAQLAGLSVLLVDDMALVRQELRSQLAQLGATQVTQASTPDDAIDKLQRARFDLVLCDYNLNRQTDGQQLLEFVRANGILTPATLFVMVTAEQEYVAVAAAAEVMPDDYVLKPFTTHMLGERLKALLARQIAFKSINHRLARKDYVGAATACAEWAGPTSKYQVLALRRQAECHFEVGQHAQAKAAYEQLLGLREDLPWAQLGLARCLKAAGLGEPARAMAAAVVENHPKFIRAYDLLAELADEAGDRALALRTLLASAAVVPSAQRSRRVADVAYRCGDLACARTHYATARKLSRGSRTADPLDTLKQAQVHLDEGDAGAAVALLSDPQTAYAARVGAPTLVTATAALEARALALSGDAGGARVKLQEAADAGVEPGADLTTLMLAKAHLAAGQPEAATGLFSVMVRGDHENRSIVGLVRQAMADGGLADRIPAVVDEAIEGAMASIKHAESLVRQLNEDGAVKCIEAALAVTPHNTAVLIAASQTTLIWMSRQSSMDRATVQKVRGYLATLDRLLPGNARVAKQHQFFHRTLARLATPRQAA